MTKNVSWLLVCAAAVSLGACAPTGSRVGQDALLETPWVAQTIDGQAVASPGSNLVAIAPDGQVRGQSDCASFTGQADFDGNRVTFRDLDVTASDCSREASLETVQFLKALTASDRWSIQDRYLLLFRQGSIVPSRLLRQPQDALPTQLADQPAQPPAAQTH